MMWLRKERGRLAHLYDSAGTAVCGTSVKPPGLMDAAREAGKRCPDCVKRWETPLSKTDMAKSGHFGVKRMRQVRANSEKASP